MLISDYIAATDIFSEIIKHDRLFKGTFLMTKETWTFAWYFTPRNSTIFIRLCIEEAELATLGFFRANAYIDEIEQMVYFIGVGEKKA